MSAGLSPPFDAAGAYLRPALPLELDGRREQDEMRDRMPRLAGLARGGLHGDESSEARADEHDVLGRQRRDPVLELLQHPRDGERRERRLVEIRAQERHCPARQTVRQRRSPWRIAAKKRSRAGNTARTIGPEPKPIMGWSHAVKNAPAISLVGNHRQEALPAAPRVHSGGGDDDCWCGGGYARCRTGRGAVVAARQDSRNHPELGLGQRREAERVPGHHDLQQLLRVRHRQGRSRGQRAYAEDRRRGR